MPSPMGIAIGVSILIVLVAGFFWRRQNQADAAKSSSNPARTNLDSQSVSLEDVAYMAQVLAPSSNSSTSTKITPMEVLWTALTTPEVLACAATEVEEVERTKQKRIQQLQDEARKAEKQSTHFDFDDDDDDDWGGDAEDEEDEKVAAQLAQAEAEKKRDLERLKKATGQSTEAMEGVDEGVLGQEWVQKTLTAQKLWPPVVPARLQAPLNAAKVSIDSHAGLRRYFCMTMGRLNAQMLNTHPELLAAGAQQKIDQTYFKKAIAFRGRVGLVLEALLRLAVTLQQTELVQVTVQTVALFKLGCQDADDKTQAWFRQQMQAQYQCQPELVIRQAKVQTEKPAPGKPEDPIPAEPKDIPTVPVAAGGSAYVILTLERGHAERFVQVKIAQAQKQNMPPQVALQSYREGWWFLLKLKFDSKNTKNTASSAEDDAVFAKIKAAPIASKIPPAVLEQYQTQKQKQNNNMRLLQAFPMMVQNCAQKSGQIQVQFSIPKSLANVDCQLVLDVLSQDFIASDQRDRPIATLAIGDVVAETAETADPNAKKDQ